MTRYTQWLGAVSAVALVTATSSPVLAAGTTAGDTITNNVTVTYQVGNDPDTQLQAVASDEFIVDRKIDLVTSFAGTGDTSVAPGSQNQVLDFDVQNLSNSVVDMNLAAALSGGTGAASDIGLNNSGTFTAGSFEIYLDIDDDGTLDANDLAAGPITSLDDMAEDEIRSVLVVADFNSDVANDETFNVTLTATALNPDGSTLSETTTANTAAEDTVFADGDGATDAEGDAAFSSTGTYVVAGADVEVAKSSTIIEDPINGTTNPKAIPGAIVEYCITVSNAADSATATAVNVIDDLPADVAFASGGAIFIDQDGDCSGGTDGNGSDASFSSGTGPSGADQILASVPDIPASTTRSVYFRVTIR